MTTSQTQTAVETLRRDDRILAGLMDSVGPFSLPRPKSYFQTLVEAIVWQQLSWKAACAIYARLLDVVGSRRIRPGQVAGMPRRRLLGVGLSRSKTDYILGLAEHFEAGRFPARSIGRMPDERVIDVLTAIRGIGTWSAEMFLIFGLHRLDVFPLGDLGLRRAMARSYLGRDDAPDDELLGIGDRWRPYRTVGVWYMWSSADTAPVGFQTEERRW